MSACDDVTRSLVEGQRLTDPLRDHVRTCPACAAMVQVSAAPAARGDEALPDALRAALDADGGAVTPFSPWRVALIPAAVTVSLAALALAHPRGDLAGQPRAPFAVAALSLVALVVAGVTSVVHRGARGLGLTASQRAAYAALALPLFAAVIAATTRAAPGSVIPADGDTFHAFAHCAAFGSVAATLSLAALLAAARRSSPVAPALVGAVAGVASGFVGALLLHIACPVATISHGVFAHGAPALVAGVLGALVGRRVLSP